MKYFLVFLFLFAGSLSGHAQDAKVVQLSDSDAREAKQLYEDMKLAEKKWEDFQSRVQGTYKGFDGGIEFSSDFKFIVPKSVTTLPYWGNGSCMTLTPAFNTPGSITFAN